MGMEENLLKPEFFKDELQYLVIDTTKNQTITKESGSNRTYFVSEKQKTTKTFLRNG